MAARKRNTKRIPESDGTRPFERPEPQLDLFAGDSGPDASRAAKFYFSTRLERLIDALSFEMRATRPVDFFSRPPAVWVPNRNLRRWIQMELAEREAVAAHLEFQFLESGLWSLLLALDPERERPQPLDRVDLEYLVLTALQEIVREPEPVFEPFFEYLRDPDGPSAGRAPRQLYQLAVRLASLFQEYEYHRGDMIAAWSGVPDLSGAAPEHPVPEDRERREIYLAERALYRRVFGVGPDREGGRLRALDRFGGRALSLSAYARIVLIERRSGLADSEGLDRAVHIFGMSQMSAFHLALLSELGEFVDLRMYFPFAPEHWRGALGPPDFGTSYFANTEKDISHGDDADFAAAWCEASIARSGPAPPGSEHRAVSVAERLNDLWARPARELLRLLARHSRRTHRFYWDAEDRERFAAASDEVAAAAGAEAGQKNSGAGETESQSVLAALQRELLFGGVTKTAAATEAKVDAGPGAAEALTDRDLRSGLLQDASIQIIGCPGLRREAETIYHNILFQMQRDPTLRLTDIAVLVPDMQTYRPVLQAVFDADRDPRSGAPRVPYNLSDFSAGDASVYGAGVASVLALADSEFTRKDLFDLFLNPCFLSKHRLDRGQVLGWLEWAERLKIHRGMDASHQAELGIEADGRYTWERALERLRLGTIMTVPQSPGDFRHFASLVPYSDIESGENDSIGVLSVVCSDLYASLRESRECFRRDDSRGFDIVREILDRHLQPPEDRPGEAGVRSGVFSALHRMSRHANAIGRLPAFDLFREILAGQVGGVAGNRGNYLAGGVTIAALQPMRPIPFRIVYVPGMGEGDFPGHPDLSVLNLRNLERRIGDATMPESNRMLFLENLLSVRDRLYLTYVSRDIQRDTEYHPCSVVTELKTGLARFCDGEAQSEYREGRVPLRLSGEAHLFFEASDESDALACYSTPDRALALRQHLRGPARYSQAERAALVKLLEEQHHSRRADPPAGEAPDESDDSQTGASLRLRDLQEFLRDPTGALLRRRLGLFDEGDRGRRALEEDERFFLDARTRRSFLREALNLQMKSSASDEEVYAEAFEDARRRDRLPRGAFAELERANLGREFYQRSRHIREACGDVEWLPELRVGSGDLSSRDDADLADPEKTRGPLHTPPWSPGGALVPDSLELHASLRNFFVRNADESAESSRPGVLVLSFAAKVRTEDFLAGFLAVLLARALALDPERNIDPAFAPVLAKPCEVLVIARAELRSITVDVSPESGASYLRTVAADFLAGRFETLPLALIEHRSLSRKPHLSENEQGSPPAKARAGSYVDELRSAWEDHGDEFYQMELARLLPAQFPEDAEAVVRRRYALPFASLVADSPRKGGVS
ncbi:MAG: exodeoxyribonuclease V subunit gamma [bacterium]|nr:exodeoxyribonuclease V subunit gamma [bacterium]